jgi:hypothetical protein
MMMANFMRESFYRSRRLRIYRCAALTSLSGWAATSVEDGQKTLPCGRWEASLVGFTTYHESRTYDLFIYLARWLLRDVLDVIGWFM